MSRSHSYLYSSINTDCPNDRNFHDHQHKHREHDHYEYPDRQYDYTGTCHNHAYYLVKLHGMRYDRNAIYHDDNLLLVLVHRHGNPDRIDHD